LCFTPTQRPSFLLCTRLIGDDTTIVNSQLEISPNFSVLSLLALLMHLHCLLQLALSGKDNPLVEAVEPAAELAAAILKKLAPAATANIAAQMRASEAAAALSAVTGSFGSTAASSSSSSGSSKLGTALLHAVSAAICTADVLAFRMFSECAQDGPPIEPAEERSRIMLTSNRELQDLLLVHLGYATQEMHASMRGKTAVSAAAMLQPKATKQQRQQQQQQRPVLADVEPHHEKLLQLLLGVPFVADVSMASRTPDISPNSAINTMFALIYNMTAIEEAADLKAAAAAAAASRSSNRRRQQQQQQPMDVVILPAGTHEPLLLTLLQLLQLVPSMRTAEALLQLMQQVLTAQSQIMRQSMRTSDTGSGTVVYRGGHPALFGQVQGLVAPLLHQLGPAVLHAERVNRRAVADGEEEDYELADVLIPNFWAGG
jgi:hypothetical protein